MKKTVLILLLILFSLCARAETARDVTAEALIEIVGSDSRVEKLRDRDEDTGISAPAGKRQYLIVTPGDQAIAAAKIEFGPQPSSVAAERYDGEEWRTLSAYENPGYSQALIRFPAQTAPFRLAFTPLREGDKLYIRELYLYSEGEPDAERAHTWQAAPEKADILFVATHPDDELLWFGGAIPSCVDAGKSVQVVYLTCGKPTRRLELLNGLWHCGVRGYPEILYLEDEKVEKEQALKDWDEEQTVSRLVRLIRAYRPEVVVTHGADGEYGHVQHVLCAELMQKAVRQAADASFRPHAGAPWRIKKLYLHGGDKPTLRMDWDAPLASFGGKTGIEVAREAYQYHVSQHKRRYQVAAAGEKYDSTLYTLTVTRVGKDSEKNDFFEHIEEKN